MPAGAAPGRPASSNAAAGGYVAGTVTDAATSLPLANVEVYIYTCAGAWVTYVSTDGSGAYATVDGIPAGTYYAKTWNSLGYVDEVYDDAGCTGGSSCFLTSGTPIVVAEGTTTGGIDFALNRGGQVAGAVVDEATTLPLAGTIVYVYDTNGTLATVAQTSPLGAYASDGLPAGTYFVSTRNSLGYVDELYSNVACPGGLCTTNAGTPVAVTAGVTTTVDFGLAAGGRIGGTVTDAATSLPLAGVTVNIYNSIGTRIATGTTDASGVYTSSTGLPAGIYYARTSNSQGYLEELYDDSSCVLGTCTVTTGTPVTVTLGATRTGIDFALAAGGRIRGTVTDAGSGLPLAGVSVVVYGSSGLPVTLGSTNGSGVYTSNTGLPTGTYYLRTSNSKGYVDELYDGGACPGGLCTVTSGTPVNVAAGVVRPGIDFGLTMGGRIAGTVTEVPTGRPLASVQVRVYDSSGAQVASAYSDCAGAYTTAIGLPAGPYRVRTSNARGYVDEQYDGVPCPGGTCPVSSGAAVAVSLGATATGVDFGLARGGRISGTVADSFTSLPLRNVEVAVFDAGGLVTSGSTDAAGLYTSSSGLVPGTYYVRTSNAQGYIDELYDDVSCPAGSCTPGSGTPVVVTAGATTTGISFRLAGGGRISGTVTDAATSLPVAGVQVRIHDAHGAEVASGTTGQTGVFTSGTGLPTGAYYARTSNTLGYVEELYDDIPCAGGVCTVTSGSAITVTQGSTRTGVNFALARGGGVRGTVTDAASTLPLAGVDVYVYGSAGTQVASGRTDSLGGYTSSHALPSGTYHLRTSNSLGYFDELYDDKPCPDGACTVTTGDAVTVAGGSITPGIDFALSPGGRLSGTVTDSATSLPLPGVPVSIYTSSGHYATNGVTSGAGVYVSRNPLPTGTYYARTSGALGYVDELYDDISCPGGACVVTVGTAITVTAGATTPGVDFALAPNAGLDFFTLTPCRMVDTRDADGPLGGPILVAGSARTFTITGPRCGIPADARAVSANVTVTGATQNGNVRLYPAGTPAPTTSTVNYVAGVTRANNATIALNASGQATVLPSPSGSVHFIVDVNGYYR